MYFHNFFGHFPVEKIREITTWNRISWFHEFFRTFFRVEFVLLLFHGKIEISEVTDFQTVLRYVVYVNVQSKCPGDIQQTRHSHYYHSSTWCLQRHIKLKRSLYKKSANLAIVKVNTQKQKTNEKIKKILDLKCIFLFLFLLFCIRQPFFKSL